MKTDTHKLKTTTSYVRDARSWYANQITNVQVRNNFPYLKNDIAKYMVEFISDHLLKELCGLNGLLAKQVLTVNSYYTDGRFVVDIVFGHVGTATAISAVDANFCLDFSVSEHGEGRLALNITDSDNFKIIQCASDTVFKKHVLAWLGRVHKYTASDKCQTMLIKSLHDAQVRVHRLTTVLNVSALSLEQWCGTEVTEWESV